MGKDPLVPDIIEQYGQVLENIINADTPADIPDPIDKDPSAGGDTTSSGDDGGSDDNNAEGRDWENRHPEGPF